MSKFALPCIKCGKPLENVDSDSDNQPAGGTEFQTVGHYGSTIWDRGGFLLDETVGKNEATHLVVNICDTCILRAIDAGVIQSRGKGITLSRQPIREEERAWVLAQNYKHYGCAYGEDEAVDYNALMLKAGWPKEMLAMEDELRESFKESPSRMTDEERGFPV